MKRILLLAFILMLADTALGEDLRIAAQKAKAEHKAAMAEARKSELRILNDQAVLDTEVKRLENHVGVLESEITVLEQRLDELQAAEDQRSQGQSDQQIDLREYTGVVREAVRDLQSILSQSHFSAFYPDRLDRLLALLKKDHLPGMMEITMISEQFFQEMTFCAEIDRHSGTFIAPGGEETEGLILTIGSFCAAYKNEEQTGFLHYNEANQRFFALSKPTPWLMRRNLDNYIQGESDAVIFDFSRGAALKQLAYQSSWQDKLKKGGLILWPILGIGLFAAMITVERILYLNRVHTNTDCLMGQVNQLAQKGDWIACDRVLKPDEGKPVYNVLRAGLSAVNETRETLESVLQEAILKELPRLERFLPALNIMGAIAPLLGLLGTVTGMISTFQSITLHGAGDPRMMSGGISEALITTMLGLTVAIPIMLVHTFLRRRLEHIVGDMEEKAVALSNIICRECAPLHH